LLHFWFSPEEGLVVIPGDIEEEPSPPEDDEGDGGGRGVVIPMRGRRKT
jgi:hypothetical protein